LADDEEAGGEDERSLVVSDLGEFIIQHIRRLPFQLLAAAVQTLLLKLVKIVDNILQGVQTAVKAESTLSFRLDHTRLILTHIRQLPSQLHYHTSQQPKYILQPRPEQPICHLHRPQMRHIIRLLRQRTLHILRLRPCFFLRYSACYFQFIV